MPYKLQHGGCIVTKDYCDVTSPYVYAAQGLLLT